MKKIVKKISIMITLIGMACLTFIMLVNAFGGNHQEEVKGTIKNKSLRESFIEEQTIDEEMYFSPMSGEKTKELPPENNEIVYKTYQNGEVVYYNPTTGEKCNDYLIANSNTANASGCLKWYAFLDEDTSEINLLLDHNTTGTIAYNESGVNSSYGTTMTNAINALKTSWTSASTTIRLITANEIAKITGHPTFDSTQLGQDFYYFDTNTGTQKSTCKLGSTSGCNYGWLYDRTNTTCINHGCSNNADGLMYGYGYWTASSYADDSYTAWRVNRDGRVYYDNVDRGNYYGLRPVVTIPKSILEQ